MWRVNLPWCVKSIPNSCLTPRIAFPGWLVIDYKDIANHYMKGFFWIDFLACYPATYIGMIVGGEESASAAGGEETTGGETKALKLVRLLRLGKMLRLAKIKYILTRLDESYPGVVPTSKARPALLGSGDTFQGPSQT